MNETIAKMRCLSIACCLINQTGVPNDVHECFNSQKLPNKFMTMSTLTQKYTLNKELTCTLPTKFILENKNKHLYYKGLKPAEA